MFAGRTPGTSNVRSMQLFYELKQLHPAASDAALSGCVAASEASAQRSPRGRSLDHAPQEVKEDPDRGQMGRPAPPPAPHHPLPPPPAPSDAPERPPAAPMRPKRPDRLDVGRRRHEAAPGVRLSGRCRDVHRLLNADADVGDKPPPSAGVRRLPASPDAHKRLAQDPPPAKKETCSTPTQTTDTLITGNQLNLSLNVNCSVGVVGDDAPPPRRRTSLARLVPAQPWLAPPPAAAAGHASSSSSSPRSFTSVSLTLRPPADTPAAPIDITSKNSTLTYSTSSFDSARGLQSRLQITVGPAGGSVSSVRVRPKSYHAPEEGGGRAEGAGRVRAGSLGGAAVGLEAPLLLKQQARIEKLRIEMQTRRAKLESVKREIEEIERNRLRLLERDEEKRLLLEIKHLTWQCKDLESDGEAFYSNIYTGQQGPLTLDPPRRRPPPRAAPDPEGPKWNCGLCTFLNHPVLDKCEQCEMPRILHGTHLEAVNLNALYSAGARSLSAPHVGAGAQERLTAIRRGVSEGNAAETVSR